MARDCGGDYGASLLNARNSDRLPDGPRVSPCAPRLPLSRHSARQPPIADLLRGGRLRALPRSAERGGAKGGLGDLVLFVITGTQYLIDQPGAFFGRTPLGAPCSHSRLSDSEGVTGRSRAPGRP